MENCGAKIIDEPALRSIEQEGRDMEIGEGRVHDSAAQPLREHAHVPTQTHTHTYSCVRLYSLLRIM